MGGVRRVGVGGWVRGGVEYVSKVVQMGGVRGV